MTVKPEEAGALLADIAGVERRARAFLTYNRISDSALLWGAIWFAGNCASHFLAPWSGRIWIGLDLFGLAASIVMAAGARHRNTDATTTHLNWRIPAVVLCFFAFGSLWLHLGQFSWRAEAAFWPTLFSFALVLFGLWIGRALIAAGAILAALTLAGYWLSGSYYDLWMAIAGGGTLIGIGLWLRS